MHLCPRATVHSHPGSCMIVTIAKVVPIILSVHAFATPEIGAEQIAFERENQDETSMLEQVRTIIGGGGGGE